MTFVTVLETSNEICQRLHTPPRALLNMDITQRNAHQLQTRASLSPPPPAPVSVRDSNPPLHPPIAALVSQRREALVRTNPRIGPVSLLRKVPKKYHATSSFLFQNIPNTQHFQNPRSAQALLNHTPNRYQPRPGPSHQQQYQYPPQMPRYHSEESLPSKMGLYSSRIHSSADEISSINRSPSELSSSDESFSRTDFSRDEDGESPSPPSRPRSHAPWIYPSDIQIDPSSLEVSPKLQHMEFPDGNANESDNDPLRDLRMPSIGPSPSTFNNSERETSHEPDEEPDDVQDDQGDQDLRSRLNLPPGVTGAESCRSASPGDIMTDSYRGDSCGSFEFLTRSSRRTSSGKHHESEEDEDQLFFPQRNEEKVAILRQIQSLNEGHDTTEESRESSAVPEVNLLETELNEDDNPRQVESQVLDEIQKSIHPPPPPIMASVERTIPLVVAAASEARNPRIRGKPSRLRDLQQPVPMEENPQEETNPTR